MNLEELKRKMDKEHYIYDDTLSTVLYVALQLGRPLLIEGAAGVGKTEVALRAAFKCVMGGKQCAILAPTTLLAWQLLTGSWCGCNAMRGWTKARRSTSGTTRSSYCPFR